MLPTCVTVSSSLRYVINDDVDCFITLSTYNITSHFVVFSVLVVTDRRYTSHVLIVDFLIFEIVCWNMLDYKLR